MRNVLLILTLSLVMLCHSEGCNDNQSKTPTTQVSGNDVSVYFWLLAVYCG